MRNAVEIIGIVAGFVAGTAAIITGNTSLGCLWIAFSALWFRLFLQAHP